MHPRACQRLPVTRRLPPHHVLLGAIISIIPHQRQALRNLIIVTENIKYSNSQPPSGRPRFYRPPLPTQITHVALANPPSSSPRGVLSLNVIISCTGLPGLGAGMVFASASEDDEVVVQDVVVGDGALLPPCIAFALLPVPRYMTQRTMLWIAGLGLDSLWLSFVFPSSSSSSSHPTATVTSECLGLNLGAHTSSCTGDACRDE